MENIKVKKAPKRLKAWIAKQVQVCQLVKGKARFAVQGMNACGRYKTVEIFSELPKPSFNYCKETPYWQADNFVFWAPCPDFVAFGIIYQLED
jgi:hypothetical protein